MLPLARALRCAVLTVCTTLMLVVATPARADTPSCFPTEYDYSVEPGESVEVTFECTSGADPIVFTQTEPAEFGVWGPITQDEPGVYTGTYTANVGSPWHRQEVTAFSAEDSEDDVQEDITVFINLAEPDHLACAYPEPYKIRTGQERSESLTCTSPDGFDELVYTLDDASLNESIATVDEDEAESGYLAMTAVGTGTTSFEIHVADSSTPAGIDVPVTIIAGPTVNNLPDCYSYGDGIRAGVSRTQEVYCSDRDRDAIELSFEDSEPAHGTIGAVTQVAGPDENDEYVPGSFAYTATSPGSEAFTAVADDGFGTAEFEVSLMVYAADDNELDPACYDYETYATSNGGAQDIGLGCYDPHGDLLTVEFDTEPAHGQASSEVAAGRTYIEYTPDPDFVGTDEFTVHVQDSLGAESPTATVTVHVDDEDGEEPGDVTIDITSGNDFAELFIDGTPNPEPINFTAQGDFDRLQCYVRETTSEEFEIVRAPTACANSYNFDVVNPTPLGTGTYIFEVEALDVDDDILASSSLWVTYDTTDPEVVVLSRPSNPTSLTSARVTFEAEDIVASLDRDLSFDNGAAIDVPCDDSVVTRTNLAQGDYDLTIVATDELGRDSDVETVSWTVAPGAPASQFAEPGGDVQSNADAPVQTSVRFPSTGVSGADVTFTTANTPGTSAFAEPTNWDLIGFETDISITGADAIADAGAPYVLSFDLPAATLTPGQPATSYVVVRDGAPISQTCTHASAAIPDPCIESRVIDGAGLHITIRSTHASKWIFAKANPPAGGGNTGGGSTGGGAAADTGAGGDAAARDLAGPVVKAAGKPKCAKPKNGVKACALTVSASDASGLKTVEANIVRKLDKKGKNCLVYSGGKFKTMTCAKAAKVFVKIANVKGKYVLNLKGKGAYTLKLRGTDTAGNITTGKNSTITL